MYLYHGEQQFVLLLPYVKHTLYKWHVLYIAYGLDRMRDVCGGRAKDANNSFS